MSFVFSHVEYCDMHFVYGFCDGNARAAVQEYERRFPNRRIPFRSVFMRIHQTLRELLTHERTFFRWSEKAASVHS
jgi:hypothetical protein